MGLSLLRRTGLVAPLMPRRRSSRRDAARGTRCDATRTIGNEASIWRSPAWRYADSTSTVLSNGPTLGCRFGSGEAAPPHFAGTTLRPSGSSSTIGDTSTCLQRLGPRFLLWGNRAAFAIFPLRVPMELADLSATHVCKEMAGHFRHVRIEAFHRPMTSPADYPVAPGATPAMYLWSHCTSAPADGSHTRIKRE